LRSIKNTLWKTAAVGVLTLPVIVGYWPRLPGFAAGDFSLWERLLTQYRVVVLYGSLVLYPHPDRLNLLHEIPTSRSVVDPVSTLASLILIIAILALAFWAARRIPLVSFCILWMAVNLFIESSVVREDMIFEHRMYLPMVGVALLAGYGVGRVPERMWKWTGALAVTVLLLLGTAAHVRNRVWSDEVTLWSDVASKSKGDTRILTNLGNALQKAGRFEEAIRHQRSALEIEPNSATLQNNLGAAMMLNGQDEQALVHFTESVRLEPNLGSAYANMGLALQKLGRSEEAAGAFVKALRVDPRLAGIRHRLAMALSEQGKTEEALIQLNVAVRNNPEDATAYYIMGGVQQRQRNFEEAERSFRRALAIDPAHWEARLSLGLVLDQQRQLDEAANAFSAALRINPRSANAHNGLGATLVRAGKLNEARNQFLEALRIDPDHDAARANLNRINAD
jgi:tetratricopeptide (TPR) repeat protein